MRTIQLSDPLFSAAERLAEAAGFTSVDAFVADLVDQEASARQDDLANFFTAERLAEIDLAVAEADSKGTRSMEDVDAYFVAKRAEWAAKRAS